MIKTIWSFVFRKWLVNRSVVKVKTWRTAIVEGDKESRQTVTPCFKFLWMNFD